MNYYRKVKKYQCLINSLSKIVKSNLRSLSKLGIV